MAYVEKYFHDYCDDYGTPCKVSILERDYEGESIEVQAAEDPFLIVYESESDFLYEPIRPSSAEINLVLGKGITMEDIWTADEKKYKVIHYVDGAVDWTGFIIPDGFQHELKGGIYYATLNASDGLSTLEKLLFVYDNGDIYGRQDLTYNNGAEFPFSLIATEVLRKLNLDLDTWICDDVWELDAVKEVWWPNEYYNDRRADPWSQSFVNVRTYIEDSDKDGVPYYKINGNAWNCRDVIENVLRLHGCILFQSEGVWKIYRINIQEDFAPVGNQRYWVKYNTLNVYIGKEEFGDEKYIPNNTKEYGLIGDDHIIKMDQVYSLYRMYYQFTFKREGDTPKNLIQNGTFEGSNAFTSTTGGADNWFRWRSGNKWFPRVRQVSPSGGGISSVPSGVNTAVRFGEQHPGVSTSNTDPYAAVWAALKQTPNISVNKGDKLHLSMNMKIQAARGNNKGGYCYVGLVKITMLGDDGQWYYLVNKVRQPGDSTVGQGYVGAIDTQWVKNPDKRGLSDNFLAVPPGNYNDTSYRWWSVSFNVPDAPASGGIEFTIHGLGNPRGKKSDSFPPFRVYNRFIGDRLPGQWEEAPEIEEVAVVRSSWSGSDVPPVEFTNIRFDRIVANTEEFAEKIEYVYRNNNPDYTFNPDPVEVFNGDVEDENHISKITTLQDKQGKNFWRPFMREEISYASLGLITCRSIMNQYYRPNRIMEGTVKLQDMQFDSRFGFGSLPGLRWVLLRGTFNRKKGYIQDATFRQITTVPGEEGCPGTENPEEDIPDIPDGGGTEGDNDINPHWIATGDVQCQKSGGVNTGGTIIKEKDNNPNSETYGEIRWVTGEDDPEMCPIGEPTTYYFAVDDVSLDELNLKDGPYEWESDEPSEIQYTYTNLEGDKYLYLLHRAGSATGLVERIYTTGQGGNIISDWQYLSDMEVEGYNYRVLRTDYTLAEFSSFSVNFVFNQDQNQ